MAGGKMRGDVSTAVVTIARIFLHRQSNALALHLTISQFSLTSHSSLLLLVHFLSVVSPRVRAPRVISRLPLRCLTTHREKLIRGTMAC